MQLPSPTDPADDTIPSREARTQRDASLLGYRLSQAHGYEVFTVEGVRLDELRYKRHADYPDELLVRKGRFHPRRLRIPFDQIRSVNPASRIVVVRS